MKLIIHYMIRICCISLSFLFLLLFSRLSFTQDGRSDGESLYMILKNLFRNSESIIGSQKELLALWIETDILERYIYTMKLLGGSIFITSIFGLMLSGLFFCSSLKRKVSLKKVIQVLSGIPDLLFITLFIIGGIYLYKSTGIKFFQLYGINNKPYLIPLLIITFLPTIYLCEFLFKIVEDESNKSYIELARGKGLGNIKIFRVHVLQNIIPSFLIQFRIIVMIILSNIVLVEYIFLLSGYTKDLQVITSLNPITVLFNFFIFSIPLILLDITLKLKIRNKKEVIDEPL